MTEAQAKRAVLAALGHEADFSGIPMLPRIKSRKGEKLLRWMDRSGIALSLLGRLRTYKAGIAEDWHEALNQRFAKNVTRTLEMLEEAKLLQRAFRSFDVKATLLKGFTLCPDFCDDLFLRHQVDFDFLVAPDRVHAAAEALRCCGYETAHLNETGESCFLTPLQHIPSPKDDLYAPQKQRQVDLHLSLWEPISWLQVEVPEDCLEYARPQNCDGIECLSLTLEDKFLLQTIHAFRHSFRSWVRVSWLLEIGHCMETHLHDDRFWNAVVRRAGHSRMNKSVFAFVLGLVHRMFGTPIPSVLRAWTEEAMSVSLRAWLDHFAVEWAVSDWPGSLKNVFLAAEFIPDAQLRKQYWHTRLFPRKAQTSIGAMRAANGNLLLQWQAARLGYLAGRARTHAKNILALPWQQLRWKRALESSRRLNFGAAGEMNLPG
jgi:hypothetical protein